MSIQDIKQEYLREKTKTFAVSNTARESLQSGLEYIQSKALNFGTDIATSLGQKIRSEDTIQAFNNTDGNYLISIEEFEQRLKSEPIEEINSLAMKNYFIYLKSKGLLNRTALEQKCG